jgi:hypothetical protein
LRLGVGDLVRDRERERERGDLEPRGDRDRAERERLGDLVRERSRGLRERVRERERSIGDGERDGITNNLVTGFVKARELLGELSVGFCVVAVENVEADSTFSKA